ncbi:MAG: OmpA family protein [Chlamydiota bacterium]
MKRIVMLFVICTSCFFLSTSCKKSGSPSTWDKVKTAGRHMNRGIDHMCGKPYDSCQLASDDEFLGPVNEEYIPLSDEDLKMQYQLSDAAYPQPKFSPGENGSGIPNLQNFQAPSAQLSSVFQTIHFETDDHIIRNRHDVALIQRMANFLKKHSNVYVCIDGHCDERATAAYNMALGTRRSNQVRVLLIKNGVDFNRIYTVSYGKEKPIALGHGDEAWKENRRAEFKIYEK